MFPPNAFPPGPPYLEKKYLTTEEEPLKQGAVHQFSSIFHSVKESSVPDNILSDLACESGA